jgi:dTDP-glucose pyrophosphorylase
MANWEQVVVQPNTRLAETIARVDASALQIALVAEPSGRLVGVVTDGDIRRAILRGATLDSPIETVMNPQPKTLKAGVTREELLAYMRLHVLHHAPIVDANGKLVDLALLDDLLGARQLPNWVVLMVGGKGTRLRPLTDTLPKPMLLVSGRPILESMVMRLAEQGFHRIFLAVNYKAELIQAHFGDGAKWGVEIEYLQEEQQLGTAGALSLLPTRPEAPVLVMNGDLLTHASLDKMLHFHRDHRADGTMAIREYDLRVPFGVVSLDGEEIRKVEEKPVQRFYVSAGMYTLSSAALALIPSGTFFDMPALFQRLIEKKMTTVAYPLREYWLDVGHLEALEQAQREWTEP